MLRAAQGPMPGRRKKEAKKMNEIYPECPFRNPECFGKSGKRCTILTNTDFEPGRPCPFYKDRKDMDPEIAGTMRAKKKGEKKK